MQRGKSPTKCSQQCRALGPFVIVAPVYNIVVFYICCAKHKALSAGKCYLNPGSALCAQSFARALGVSSGVNRFPPPV